MSAFMTGLWRVAFIASGVLMFALGHAMEARASHGGRGGGMGGGYPGGGYTGRTGAQNYPSLQLPQTSSPNPSVNNPATGTGSHGRSDPYRQAGAGTGKNGQLGQATCRPGSDCGTAEATCRNPRHRTEVRLHGNRAVAQRRGFRARGFALNRGKWRATPRSICGRARHAYAVRRRP